MPKGIGYPFRRAAKKVAKAAMKGGMLGVMARKKRKKLEDDEDFKKWLKKMKAKKSKGVLTDKDFQRMKQLYRRERRMK